MVMSTTREDWSPFRCEVEPERGCVRVAPHGELDLATAPQVAQRLRDLCESGFEHIVLDLRAVRFMDSSGLRLVMREDAAARAEGRTFRIVPGPPAVQRLFELTCVLDRLQFLPR
jgi:anti-sigma B factor antagonist